MGKPVAVLLSMNDYQTFRQWQKQATGDDKMAVLGRALDQIGPVLCYSLWAVLIWYVQNEGSLGMSVVNPLRFRYDRKLPRSTQPALARGPRKIPMSQNELAELASLDTGPFAFENAHSSAQLILNTLRRSVGAATRYSESL